ncbi:hypothetical protein C8Q74DRAFT_1219086 [Fomes fomentarius]|nr:hypothetical protein C8Q74DRAFT_1219086 [Fomes fomentarius]
MIVSRKNPPCFSGASWQACEPKPICDSEFVPSTSSRRWPSRICVRELGEGRGEVNFLRKPANIDDILQAGGSRSATRGSSMKHDARLRLIECCSKPMETPQGCPRMEVHRKNSSLQPLNVARISIVYLLAQISISESIHTPGCTVHRAEVTYTSMEAARRPSPPLVLLAAAYTRRGGLELLYLLAKTLEFEYVQALRYLSQRVLVGIMSVFLAVLNGSSFQVSVLV